MLWKIIVSYLKDSDPGFLKVKVRIMSGKLSASTSPSLILPGTPSIYSVKETRFSLLGKSYLITL